MGKFVVSPAINWSTTEKGLSVSRKIKGGKLKGSYGFDNHSAGIEYDFKPYKVGAKYNSTSCAYRELRIALVSVPRQRTIDIFSIPSSQVICLPRPSVLA